jgi:hypothetical protein
MERTKEKCLELINAYEKQEVLLNVKHPQYYNMLSRYDVSQQFGNLIAAKLRKYDDMTRSLIQNEIFGIFLNAERGLYNQTQYVSGFRLPPSPQSSSSFGSIVHMNIDVCCGS